MPTTLVKARRDAPRYSLRVESPQLASAFRGPDLVTGVEISPPGRVAPRIRPATSRLALLAQICYHRRWSVRAWSAVGVSCPSALLNGQGYPQSRPQPAFSLKIP
jgi:hypothetical protein